MKRRLIFQALAICALGSALFLAGCSTTESRIAEKSAAFQQMSQRDQALITQGRIRNGMSQEAVYIAWGAPNQTAEGRHRRSSVETWIYFNTTSGYDSSPFLDGPYAGFGYGYGYGGGYGFSRFGRYRRYGGYYYNPFYDPYFYNRTSVVSYPDRTVSFQNGRVIAYQYLPAPRFL
ncbi:MAG: hypothetical protein M3Y03_06735 [Verrucomicrobiota bacterium]|nr:hypothetical protein [Verrucomicrobiota bacterium]